jgi:DNA topoisomerase-2
MSSKKINKKNPITSSPAIITERETDNYLNNEVKIYANYVITTRALPNIMDGLRVGARKIVYAGMTGKLKKGSKEKMPVLIGNTMELEFHHGDASLKNTIEQLASKHLFEYAPFNVIGQTGTLRVPDCTTAARYLKVEINENINFFRNDLDILNYNFEDGKYVEPKNFLPIIPIILLWRTNSPGFGFSFRSFSHDINDVIDATITSLISGSCNDLHFVPIKPKVLGINPDNIIFNNSKNSWYNVGEYEIDEANNILKVTDLPFNISYKKYEFHLKDLLEQGYITDYQNLSRDNKVKVIIKFSNNRLSYLLKEKWKFFTKMKLFTKIPNLTLNTIDIDGKSIINFDSPQSLVDGFVRRRLNFYRHRKIKMVNNIEKDIFDLSDKAKFIQLVVDDKLVINKRKVVDVKADCDKFQVSYEGLKLTALKFTQEEIEKALNEIINLKSQLEYIKNTSIENMYMNDLIELKQKVSKIEIQP